jgi:regulator of replication initiation timing
MVVKFKRIEPPAGSRIFSLKKAALLALLITAFWIFLNRDRFPIYADKIDCPENGNLTGLDDDIHEIVEKVSEATKELENLESNLRKIREENENLFLSNQNLTSKLQKINEEISLVKRGIFEPSLIYERHRRRVRANIMYVWDFVDHRMLALIPQTNNDSTVIDIHITMNEMIK